jgi:hypothetical protein
MDALPWVLPLSASCCQPVADLQGVPEITNNSLCSMSSLLPLDMLDFFLEWF